jgi:hypothetical protein
MKTIYSFLGFAGITTAILMDAAQSKAIMYIDFIPLSPTSTRIQASGTINPTLLGTFAAGTVSTAASGGNTSAINKATDSLRFTYSSSTVSNPGRRYAITGPTTDPFSGGGNTVWTGTTPVNNPPLQMRFGSSMDLWLPNSFTGGASPINSALPVAGFFNVNLTLTAIFGASAPSQFAFTSGTEQIILRNNPTLVPGPLPLLGAAAAFGYSRKLRNRIQKSTPTLLA